MIIQNPTRRGIDYAFELAVIPLGNLICHEQRFVMSKSFWNIHWRHSHEHAHD
jgi:hypothetical protein